MDDRTVPSSSGRDDKTALLANIWDEGQTVVNEGDLAGEDPALRPSLTVVAGSADQREIKLGAGPVRIGRAAGNDLVLNDESVSRNHAQIVFEGWRWVIEDLGSSNGVRIGEKIVTKSPLETGMRLVLGRCTVEFSHDLPAVTTEQRLALIEKNSLLAALDREAKETLLRALVPRFAPKGAEVLHQGSRVENMLFVVKGGVRLVELNDEGGERDSDLLVPGESYGERSLVEGLAASASLVANSDVLLLELPGEAVAKLLQAKPKLTETMVGKVREKLRSAQASGAYAGLRRDGLEHLVTSTDVEIIGEDKKILRAKEKTESLAKEDRPVLIVGPQGSGKRTFARHYHRSGPRAAQPYVEVSLAEIEPSQLLGALFGIDSDVTSSGGQGRVGYLELVGEGTLALVNAELLDVHQQSLLVTYLKRGWFHRVWGQQAVHSKTRVVFLASGSEHEVLDRLVPELKELLKESTVTLPPLTQRLKDIPLLAEHYLANYARKTGKRALSLSREATDRLVSYGWPGNIDELKNVIKRAAIVATDEAIIPGDLIFVLPPEKEVHKLNLLHNEKIRELLRNPKLLGTLMLINGAAVAFVLLTTLIGSLVPAGHPLAGKDTNPGMLLTWLVWFPLLPISALFIGRIWCGVCPIVGFAELAGKVKRYRLPVPKLLQNVGFWGVVVTFLLVDAFEDILGVADSPWATLIFLLVVLYAAAAMTVLFERRAFCKYVCPLSGVLGGYSTMSPVEVRGNTRVCQSQCGEHTCYKGTEAVEGCPMFSYPAAITSNTDCMMCGNCLRSCDKRGVQVNVRPPLQELWRNPRPALALSIFGVLLVGVMAFHQVGHLISWKSIEASLAFSGAGLDLTLFISLALIALAAFAFSSTLSAAASQQRVTENMAAFGLAFLPLAFSGHLAYLTEKIVGKGIYTILTYVALLFQSLFKGIPMAVNSYAVAPFINPAIVVFLKFLLVLGGAVGSLVAIVMISRRAGQNQVLARALPHLLVLALFWVGYLIVFTGATSSTTTAATESVTTAFTAPMR